MVHASSQREVEHLSVSPPSAEWSPKRTCSERKMLSQSLQWINSWQRIFAFLLRLRLRFPGNPLGRAGTFGGGACALGAPPQKLGSFWQKVLPRPVESLSQKRPRPPVRSDCCRAANHQLVMAAGNSSLFLEAPSVERRLTAR